jgi:hypothetical protein
MCRSISGQLSVLGGHETHKRGRSPAFNMHRLACNDALATVPVLVK